jgi:hypothetical protein
MLFDDPVQVLPDLISPETLAEGAPIRAVDAYLIVGQIEEALTRAMDASGDHDVFNA